MSIRIAGKKRSKSVGVQHRPFYERERELNKLTRQDLYKRWIRRMDPYKMKGLPDEEWGETGYNPFRSWSIPKIKDFIKTMEARKDPYKKENDRIEFMIEMIVNFKDILRITTSEAIAVWIIYKDKIHAAGKKKVGEVNPRIKADDIFSDAELVELGHEAMQEFKADWDKAMEGLNVLWT